MIMIMMMIITMIIIIIIIIIITIMISSFYHNISSLKQARTSRMQFSSPVMVSSSLKLSDGLNDI